MPVNRKYPLKAVLHACSRFSLKPRRRITFEYILMNGINDSAEDALRLVNLLKNFSCKINLIPLNPLDNTILHAPPQGKILQFQNILSEKHMTAILRKSKGQDIRASCGQLRSRQLPLQE
jgi:23S rRNA (adenine2503-C2)-methyltransferase